MGCGCNKKKNSTAGRTAAEINADRPITVRAADGSEQRFADYDAARRWARKVGGTVL